MGRRKKLTYIDLFAGAGGLSEGFIRQKFHPVAHVEMDKFASDTLRTRLAFHYLKEKGKISIYKSYLKGEISREELWKKVPEKLMSSVINKEISNKTIKEIFQKINEQLKKKKIDVIIGGPPCQAYSIVGRARDPNSMKDDPRNFLYKVYVRFLRKYKPKIFVFENVPGLLSASNGQYLKNIKRAIRRAGYDFDYKILNAKDFGVLQDRKRVILIGWRKKLKVKYPEFRAAENKWQVLKDLFSDLPHLKPGEGSRVSAYKKQITEYLKHSHIRNGWDFTTQHITRQHNKRDLNIYKIAIRKWIKKKKRLNYSQLPAKLKTHKNETSFTNRFQVVNPYGCCHTVVAHIACDGHYYIYPDLKQVRSVSVREAARIQSFPDDYFFEGDKSGRTAAFRQIGNAVPPLMAEAVAEKIKSLL